MTYNASIVPTLTNGFGLPDMGDLERRIQRWVMSFRTPVTAFAGGGKANATRLFKEDTCVHVATVASGADSILLPANPLPGQAHLITNNGASSMQVFGANSDTINAVATGTGVAQAAGITAMYICFSVTAAGVSNWRRLLSA